MKREKVEVLANKIRVVLIVILVAIIFISTTGNNGYQYWHNCEVDMSNGVRVEALVCDSVHNGYFNISEKRPTDVGLPYNPQVDAYLNRVIDIRKQELTDNLENIVILSTTGVYKDEVWYFLIESCYDKNTAHQIINIMGILPVEDNNLVITNFGVEGNLETLQTGVIEEFIKGYNIDYTVDDLIVVT